MKRFFIILVVLTIITFNLGCYNSIYATSINDLQSEQSSISYEIKENKDKLEEIKTEKSNALTQVEKLSSEISTYEDEIEALSTKITTLESSISEMQDQIKKDEEKYQKDKQALNEKLISMYENGNISYLDVLLSSTSLTEYISSFYLISELTNYDTEMLENLEKEKEKIESDKAGLESDKTELDASKSTKEAKQSALKVAKADKEKQVSTLTVEEKETQSKIEELQEANKQIDKEIEAAQAKIAAAKKAAEEAAKKKAAEEAAKKKAEEAKKAQENSNTSNSSSYTGNTSSNNSNSSSAGTNTSSGGSSSSSGKTSSYGFIRPVSSKFPITTTWYYSSGSLHGAVDFSGSGISGSPVYAVADGYVVTSTAIKNSSGNYSSYGNYILIAHFNGLYTLYAHLSSRSVSAGETVSQGQVIGAVGTTGNSTGPHLHFEVRTSPGKYVNRVNPLNYLP